MNAFACDVDRVMIYVDDDDIDDPDDDDESDFDTDEDNEDNEDDEDDDSDEDDVETWQVHTSARISAKSRPWLDFRA